MCLRGGGVGAEAPQSGSGGDVPEKDGAVAAAGRESLVAGGDGEGEDRVAVGGVLLDGAGRFLRGRGGGLGVIGNCAGQVDRAVGGAGEEVGAALGGENEGVDGA